MRQFVKPRIHVVDGRPGPPLRVNEADLMVVDLPCRVLCLSAIEFESMTHAPCQE